MHLIIDPFIFTVNARGGISRVYREVLPRMLEADPTVSITTVGKGGEAMMDHCERIRHSKSIAEQKWLRPRRLIRRLAAAQTRRSLQKIQTSGCGLWHSTYYTVSPEWHGASIVFVHDMIHERFPNLFTQAGDDEFRRTKAEAVRRAELIVVNSQATAEDLNQMLKIEMSRIRVAHLAAGTIFMREDLATPTKTPGKPYLLYVGDRRHYKGFYDFATAYSQWPGRSQVDVVVAGRPSTEAERTWLAWRKIDANVQFVSSPNDEELSALYRGAAAFVYPSLYEGFGIPLVEAMGSGCPIVASDIPSTREVAGDYPTYFSTGCNESLTEALNSVLHGAAPAADQGLARARRFSWESTSSVFLQACREVVGHRRPS